MKKREDIFIQDTWNLEDLVPSDEEWENLLSEAEQELPEYETYKGTLESSSQRLFQCLEFDDSSSQKLERLYVYAKQKLDQDTSNARYQDYFARIQKLSNQAAQVSAFIIPEILSIKSVKLYQFIEQDQKLSFYKRKLELLLKKKEHTLSAEMEELLAQSCEATKSPEHIFSMFNNADVQFPEVIKQDGEKIRITHGNYISLMEDKDRNVRKQAFYGLYKVYGQYKNTLAAVFAGNVKQAAFYAKARKYSSSRAYVLAESEIPENVYDNLITVVRKHLPLLHRYVSLRRQLLRLDELHMYDLYVPLIEQNDIRYTFEEAKQMVAEGLAPLGKEYLNNLKQGFSNRWIDIYENEGKRSGAYSWGAYGVHPYVLLNYNQTLDHVFTLAHEMGHAMHSYYSDSHQKYAYAGYKIFVAEVASTCNEALLIRSLLEKETDCKKRAFLLNHFLESFRGTVFRQTMFAEFEYEAHQMEATGKTLTADSLGTLYHRLNKEYYGNDMCVDDEIDVEWSRIPHFYNPFYVYQYATGFSAAIAISARILAGDEKTCKGYKEFLCGGNSMPPIDLLKLCGIDMGTFTPVEEALRVFEKILDELENCCSRSYELLETNEQV